MNPEEFLACALLLYWQSAAEFVGTRWASLWDSVFEYLNIKAQTNVRTDQLVSCSGEESNSGEIMAAMIQGKMTATQTLGLPERVDTLAKYLKELRSSEV